MMWHLSRAMLIAVLACSVASVSQAELLTNPSFDSGGAGWGAYGAAGFNDFFGGNEHASLFMDNPGNFGGVFQVGIAGAPGVEYQFDLTDVRIEANAAANAEFGLEFFAGDDSTKLGEVIDPIPLSPTGDGLTFSMSGTAVPGTVFVRPIIKFDNVTSTASGQENLFVFDASLTQVPEPGTLVSLALLGVSMAVLWRRS